MSRFIGLHGRIAAELPRPGHEPLDAACPLLPKPPRDVPEPWLLDEPDDDDDDDRLMVPEEPEEPPNGVDR